jgi:hypothetical protein
VDSHSSGTNVAACLKQPTRSQRGSRHMETYLVLLRVGFTLPPLLPAARCALTTPFHPYLCSRTNHRRSALCGTFRRLSPPRCYLALYPLEPGLSSAMLPDKRKRISELYDCPFQEPSARVWICNFAWSLEFPLIRRTTPIRYRPPGR